MFNSFLLACITMCLLPFLELYVQEAEEVQSEKLIQINQLHPVALK